MLCSYLSLANFRNYRSLALELSPGITVLHGQNASGKSTFLESLHLLATMRSNRASMDRELISWRQNEAGEAPLFAKVSGRVQRARETFLVEVTMSCEEQPLGAPPVFRKRLKVNGSPKRAIESVGILNVVLFSPEDIALVSGPPSIRRRYLDMLISQIDTRYIRTLQHYNKVLVQRNNLLKHLRDRRHDMDPAEVRRELDFWTGELAKAGSYLVARRIGIVSKLQAESGGFYHDLSGTADAVRIDYLCNIRQETHHLELETKIESEQDVPEAALEVEELFRTRLDGIRIKEIARGMTLVGPHRDDFQFFLSGVNLATYGSRGQQRMMVLSLKLGESQVMAAETSEQPVLLLDDMMSELDSEHRRYLMAAISGRNQQSLITTSDLMQFDPEFLDKATLIQIADGRIVLELD